MSLAPLPHPSRNAIFTALMTYLQTTVPAPVDPNTGKSIPFQTYSQLWQQWDTVPSVNQPAMYIRRGPQDFQQVHVFGVTKLKFRVSVWVYFRTDGYQISPSYPDQLTDSFIDGFEQAFQALPIIQRNTLNNTVYHCWVDGNVFSDGGIADGQAVIVLPLSILV